MRALSSTQIKTSDLSIWARAELPVLRQAAIFQDLPHGRAIEVLNVDRLAGY